ncbi:MAG TPA: hypothetical protein VFO20_00445 [Propionibacteriaceae bacterium]|nr:hypothetical protein [Propionibacteriaceae bacterium]
MANRRSFGYIRRLPSKRYQASYIGPDLGRHAAPDTFEANMDAKGGSVMSKIISSGEGRHPRDALLHATYWAHAYSLLKTIMNTAGAGSATERSHIDCDFPDRSPADHFPSQRDLDRLAALRVTPDV